MDRLIEKIIEKQNPSVIGLDTKLDFVPNYIKEKAFSKYGNTLKAASKAMLEFNIQLIDNLHDIIPCIKPQFAYYEMYGYHGMKTLYKTLKYAKEKNLYIISDGKRNDIGSTMEAYGNAHLGEININNNMVEPFPSDSLTVNPYLGRDGIDPLIEMCNKYDKSIFVLVKTSNPSSGELQDKKIDGIPVYETVGNMVEDLGRLTTSKYGYSKVGAVVGATYKDQLKQLRKKLKSTFFLVPGYGAQGGEISDIIEAFDNNGLGAIINSSRGIISAYLSKERNHNEKDFAKIAREQAIKMKDGITSSIGKIKLD